MAKGKLPPAFMKKKKAGPPMKGGKGKMPPMMKGKMKEGSSADMASEMGGGMSPTPRAKLRGY